ncbi:hypothetical protein R1sor_012339 [Riccia sorocarpa]|uniref:Uncharacterized protein n=1 Tax=Riccia sorocarpa TaxID=122646 RepID=A0ABD3I3H3_9MARC
MDRPHRPLYPLDHFNYHAIRRPNTVQVIRIPEDVLDTYTSLRHDLGPTTSHAQVLRWLLDGMAGRIEALIASRSRNETSHVPPATPGVVAPPEQTDPEPIENPTLSSHASLSHLSKETQLSRIVKRECQTTKWSLFREMEIHIGLPHITSQMYHVADMRSITKNLWHKCKGFISKFKEKLL